MSKVTVYEDAHRSVGGMVQKVHHVVCSIKTQMPLLSQFESFTYITKESFDMSQQHVIWNYKHINTLLTKSSKNIYCLYNRDDGYFVEDLEPIDHLVEWLHFEIATKASTEYLYSVLYGLPAHVVNRGLTTRVLTGDIHDPEARVNFIVTVVNDDATRTRDAINRMLDYGSMVGSDNHIREYETHLTKVSSDGRTTTFSLTLYTNMRKALPCSTIINITEFKERYDAFNVIPPFTSNKPLNPLGVIS